MGRRNRALETNTYLVVLPRGKETNLLGDPGHGRMDVLLLGLGVQQR